MRAKRAVTWLTCMWMCVAFTVLCLSEALWISEGDDVRSKSGLTVDYSNASNGYVLAKVKKTSSKIKLRISSGSRTYTYDLNNKGDYEVFPLQMGSGSYKLAAYRNVKGNKYTKQAEVSIKVEMPNEDSAFLYPSQYVHYTPDSPAVAKAEELCAGLKTDREKFEAIRRYLSRSFTYDYVRALSSPPGYLGDVDGCFQTGMGLCQDLAAVAACMLRSQGIPTQLAIGTAGGIYHAWNYVLLDGEYKLLDVTAEVSFMAPETIYETERIY